MMKVWLLTAALVAVLALRAKAQKKLVCYYGSWAVYRHGNGKFDVEDIDPFLCTHIIFGYAGLDPQTNSIRVLDPSNELVDEWGKGAYNRFNKLRERNPALKTLIAIGGWNEGSVTYSTMAASPQFRRTFINSVVKFLTKFPFNGLDFDWEYPANRGGNDQWDKANFVKLLKELREEFDKHGWLLTAAVSGGKAIIDSAYDVPGVARYLDFINVMTYDFHGAWENFAGHNAPLNARPDEDLEHQLMTVNYSINYWINQGARREQLILGMGLYGRSYSLVNPVDTSPGSGTIGPGTAGPYTREPGTLGYNEICESMSHWTVVQDPYYRAPYAYNYNQWVSYDDVESIKVKTQFANSLGLGGGMVWSIETDDFKGGCHGYKFPLTSTIKRIQDDGDTVIDPFTPVVSPTPGITEAISITHSEPPSTTAELESTTWESETTTGIEEVESTTVEPERTTWESETTTAADELESTTVEPERTTWESETTTATDELESTTWDTEPPTTTVDLDISRPPRGKCPSPGTHRDPTDCSRFVYCNDELVVIDTEQCLSGLLFDEISKSCKWANEVNCNA